MRIRWRNCSAWEGSAGRSGHCIDDRHANVTLRQRSLDAFRSSQQSRENLVIAHIAQGNTNQFRTVSPRGDQALEVIIFRAHHKVMRRREIAELYIGGSLQSEQRDLARSRKPLLERRNDPSREVLIEQQLHAAAGSRTSCDSREAA